MAKVLSQEEIDALLNDAQKGKDIEQLGVKQKVIEYLYDWKNPQKLNADHKRQLKQIFQIFSTSFQTYLQTTLKSMVDIAISDISTVSYSDYLLSVSEPTCMYKLFLDKLKAMASIEVQPSFVFFLVERLLGGMGRSMELPRPVSPIEENIMLRIMQNCFLALKEAFKNIMPGLNFQFNGFETNPNFVNIAPPTDVVALITLDISIKEDVFNINICFPSAVIDPILEKMTATSWKTQENITKKSINIIEDYIKYSEVEMTVEFARTELRVGDFLDLKIGDVIELDKAISDPSIVNIDSKPKFFVRPGVEGTRKAIEFIRQLTPDEERKYASRRIY
ncbi:MAG: flagellar motor switch protein FliM [Candidatus Delongbacteria bacterium]|nr:flagellar motor switch protein FliM [Candidatus Delongbacteria bacterium]MBN2834715.1 flagellar motor switch protein FliM [Candidatus Delongbacteria bacterium]